MMQSGKTFQRGRARALLAIVGAAALIAASAPRAVQGPKNPYPAHPHRLIVKFRPAVEACIDCLVGGGASLSAQTGSDQLDRMISRGGVKRARPLFAPTGASGDVRRRVVAGRADQALRRFPQRSSRAPAAAKFPDLSNVYVLELAGNADPARLAAEYAKDPNVEYAEPDFEVQAALTTNDPFLATSGSWGQAYYDLWGVHITEAPTAWNTSTGTGVVVAVIDTGVDDTHPDLAANLWTNPGEIPGNQVDDDGNGFVDDVHGWDFTTDDNTPDDRHGHGTHVAGTIAAVGNNGIGVVGMAWTAKIMAVKGLGANGSGYVSDLAQAVVYAAENGADVLNNSWGGFGITQTLTDAVDTARSLGAVVVAAAGNSNSNVDSFEPAGIPGVIAVGATTSTDGRASFSNHGSRLSVAAPGVDVLSLRGAVSANVGGSVVADDYLRLSGTSMASPHAAGVAAILLGGLPALTLDEVQWRMELNADTLEWPGYEGLPWNPYFGYGRVNAARVFDPIPVTTRFTADPIDVHAYANQVLPDVAQADLVFTTAGSVDWTSAGPVWLQRSPAAGNGAATLAMSIDTTGLGLGRAEGQIVISAPDAVDGGASLPVAVEVHTDQRVGSEIEIPAVEWISEGPVVEGNGVGVLVVWSGYPPPDYTPGIFVSYVDENGQASEALRVTPLNPEGHFSDLSLAFDGRQYLLVWTQEGFGHDYRGWVRALRLSPTGQPIDAAPILLEQKRIGSKSGYSVTDVGFDGNGFTVVWSLVNVFTDITRTSVRRIGIDGSLQRRPRSIYPRYRGGTGPPQVVDPLVACIPGRCLVAWKEADGETSPTLKYIDKSYGILLDGDRAVGKHGSLLARDIDQVEDVVSSGDQFMVVGRRIDVCQGPVLCGYEVVGARVSSLGVPLDPNGLRLDVPSEGQPWMESYSGVFDGENYLVSLLGPFLPAVGGFQVYGVRATPAGQAVETESPGVLLHEDSRASTTAIATMRRNSLVAWFEWIVFGDRKIHAQRVLPHPQAATWTSAAIGSIGPRIVAERQSLQLELSAPGLDPATTTFSSPDLPVGAVLATTTGAFQWMPDVDESGMRSITFEASDGASNVSETVPFTIPEGSRSISGMVVDGGGNPIPGVAVKLAGATKPPRTGFTDQNGAFRFAGVATGRHAVRLTRPSTKSYRAARSVVDVAGGDVRGVNLVAALK